LTVSPKEAGWINDLTADCHLAVPVPDAEELAASRIPVDDRRGVLFVGNFKHGPNVGAVEYLCREIVPRLNPRLLKDHPLWIVGNALNDSVRQAAKDIPGVRLVGWVPSVLPYLQQSRVAVIPLQYGAGTKRKLIESLMTGTPTVSTSIGVEGLNLQDNENVLIADDPENFARHIERLLTDRELWQKLASNGRSHILGLHGRVVAKQRWWNAVEKSLLRMPKPEPPPLVDGLAPADNYAALVDKVCAAANRRLPQDAAALVVSKGDERLVALNGRRAGHFPQTEAGIYAGHYPGSSAEAIAHLQSLRSKGFGYLVLPSSAFWWLDHYQELNSYLTDHADQLHGDDVCRIYRLGRNAAVSHVSSAPNGRQPKHVTIFPSGDQPAARNGHDRHEATEQFIARVRPRVRESVLTRNGFDACEGKRVLVFGVYLANQPNTADHIVQSLSESQCHSVDQRWVALLGDAPTPRVDDVTIASVRCKTPKFQILNELMAEIDLSAYDYVMLADDYVVLPDGFLDRYIDLQEELGFLIAQPARTSNSYIDHPIVEQQKGVLARRTMFVEIGPVVSFHRSVFNLVFPFDMTSPMGWGYENVWSRRLAKRGMKMGIIDAVPVDHSLRKPVANYAWAEANQQRKDLLAVHEHYTLDQCFRVLEVIPFPQAAPESNGELSLA
jgi:hypothetical protein